IEEHCYPRAMEIDSTKLDPGNLSSQDSVLESCFGLAMIDKETSTVRLSHSTFGEYLR
ncbi:hypothetical protein L873DRAFT_1658476, partial [Choiromyces venosus 120613-1]